MTQRIAIIGAGFSGTVLAANLLRRPPAGVTEITLIERAAPHRGVAYARRGCPYLLNVPAGRLSADSQDPGQFLRFAQQEHPRTDAEDFLPRELYGDYLQDFLGRAERATRRDVKLVVMAAEVLRLTPGSVTRPWTLHFAEGEPLSAHRVILATGNPLPRRPAWADAVQDHPAYHNDPWATLPHELGGSDAVLIVGNGLTMVDIVFALSRDPARQPRLHTVSRRGLIPLTQTAFRASALQGDGAGLLECAVSIRRLLAAARTLAREVESLGGDWREVVTFLRTLAPRLWERLPDVERRRFLRHVQGYWEVHRHRLPPPMMARLEWLRRSGSLAINAGRIERLEPDGSRLKVCWRRRGHAESDVLTVDAVINATGPDYAVRHSAESLWRTLLDEGHIAADALQLGLRTGEHGACIGADGRPSDSLFYLGPLLRAGCWEMTAAPELRNYAEALAEHLVHASV